jgi:hypothetical protein
MIETSASEEYDSRMDVQVHTVPRPFERVLGLRAVGDGQISSEN